MTEDSIRILLVEDMNDDAKFVRRLLERNRQETFVVDHSESLSDALTRLQQDDYDVAMLDLRLPDADELESLEQIRALDARLPVVVLTGNDDEAVGLKAVESGAQDFIAKEHVTGQMLFRAIRFAIARQRKVMGYKAAADTDPLTGMPNRRHLESQFTAAVEASRDSGKPMSVALLDVDHFKKINDTYGHFLGDAVLKEVADLLTHEIPSGTSAARFGGEEFTLLISGHDLEQAVALVESILQKLADTPFEFESGPIHVTASAGVVEVSPHDVWDSAFVRADDALYRAKSSGRNRACH